MFTSHVLASRCGCCLWPKTRYDRYLIVHNKVRISPQIDILNSVPTTEMASQSERGFNVRISFLNQWFTAKSDVRILDTWAKVGNRLTLSLSRFSVNRQHGQNCYFLSAELDLGQPSINDNP